MDFKCKCINSGTNSFTGHCSVCGMMKPSNGTITNINTTPIMESIVPNIDDCRFRVLAALEKILQLEKYQPTFEGLMEESDEFGEYVKFEDVIKIFGASRQDEEIQ